MCGFFFEQNVSLDYLVNNAGFAGSRGLTKEGFELAFGVTTLVIMY